MRIIHRYQVLSYLPVFLMALLLKIGFCLVAIAVPMNMMAFFTDNLHLGSGLVSFAPEVWLSLLALVLGTLIIVITIASEKTPRLIDLFVTDYSSRLYLWIITLSGLENTGFQVVQFTQSTVLSNIIFINSFILLPGCVLLAIPYIFYILKYTRSHDVIDRIYDECVLLIGQATKQRSRRSIEHYQVKLIENINELHDLLQYTQFKRPKAHIISLFGKLLGEYIDLKPQISPLMMRLSSPIKNDISFRNQEEKHQSIELSRLLLEQKVLSVLANSFLLLNREGHYDLASACGNELYLMGKKAVERNDSKLTELTIKWFNTFFRHSINQALRSSEVRNIYNLIYHYHKMVQLLIHSGQYQQVMVCARYLYYYGLEASKHAQEESSFSFLVDVLANELKSILISIHEASFAKIEQYQLITYLNALCQQEEMAYRPKANNSPQIIQLTLCLYYISKQEYELLDKVAHAVLLTSSYKLDPQKLKKDCDRIRHEPEDFWEETDHANTNIYYSPHKHLIPNLMQVLREKQLEESGNSYKIRGDD
ncbi:MAG: hypothetical protein AB7K37_13185 [Cyclobacteriaceae bacterium]